MPYTNNEELPRSIRAHLPSHAQSIFRAAFNNALGEYGEESRAFRVAWAAVKRRYEKRGEQWVEKGAS